MCLGVLYGEREWERETETGRER
jgi:hypothetical protein